MKNFTLFAFTLLTSFAFATPPSVPTTDRKLEVSYVSVEEVEALFTNKAWLADTGFAFVTPKKGGQIEIKFNRVYSNSCVAGNHIILPQASLSNDRIDIAFGQTFRKMACPAVARPVLINYVTILKGLKAGNTYKLRMGTKGTITTSVQKLPR